MRSSASSQARRSESGRRGGGRHAPWRSCRLPPGAERSGRGNRRTLPALLAAGLALGAAAAEPAWRPADPGHRWSFPADHRAHPDHRNEWWYFTGLLEAEGVPGRRFGYQLTFFRAGLAAAPPRLDSAFAAGQAVMAHLTVTDLASGTHVFSELLWRAAPLTGGFPSEGELLAWALPPAGTAGRWSVQLAPDGFALSARDASRRVALDLTLRASGPPVLQGPNGFSRKSAQEGYASLYYSLPRLATAGVIEVGGERYRVRGTTWMDKEFGSAQLAPGQVGWDWFSLRLADGRDLMLYALRRADGSADFRRATLALPTGEVQLLEPEEWSAAPLARWRSPRSGAEYPSGWRIEVPSAGLALEVRPEVAGAENVSALVPGLAYWEGPVRVVTADGRPAGEGYVELTGYGAGSRPPI
jgi:predicted secreted hydrolase